eukprot:8305-Heterococcus_DN1.PRE.3
MFSRFTCTWNNIHSAAAAAAAAAAADYNQHAPFDYTQEINSLLQHYAYADNTVHSSMQYKDAV